MKLHKKVSKKKKIIIALVALVVIAGAAVGAYMVKNGHSSAEDSSYNPDKMNADSNVPKPDDDKSNGGITQANGGNETAPAPNENATPAKPVGTFVSSHSLILSSAPVEQSTCSTTPGALCKIVFTNGSTRKELGNQTTDSNGNTSWIWNAKGIGLSGGEWTVTAVAAIGNNTASTEDAMKLKVN